MTQERKNDMLRMAEIGVILIPCLAALVAAYTATKDIPAMKENIASTNVKVAVLETHYGDIKEDLTEIKRLIRRKP